MPPRLSSVLESLSSLALDDLDGLWSLEVSDLEAALFGLFPNVLETWAEMSASAAADWYDELREAEEVPGTFSAIVEPLGDLGGYALAGWAAQPLKLPEPDILSVKSRLEDGFQKRLANTANLTVTGSAKADPNARGYMRRTRPGACRFCVMVASRGAVYTESSSRFACHGGCFCEAVPAWGGRALPVEPYKQADRPPSPSDQARVREWIKENLT